MLRVSPLFPDLAPAAPWPRLALDGFEEEMGVVQPAQRQVAVAEVQLGVAVDRAISEDSGLGHAPGVVLDRQVPVAELLVDPAQRVQGSATAGQVAKPRRQPE